MRSVVVDHMLTAVTDVFLMTYTTKSDRELLIVF